jgi:glycosyltransferase involved in cell wall biosynthesis
VTAVVVTRDRPRLLADALASVASQSPQPAEVRIGNDGSEDVAEALAVLGALQAAVVRTGAGGAAVARNRAASGARGEALAFLDDDDRWLPNHVSALAVALADPAVGLAYSDCAVVREELGADAPRAEIARRVIARDWDEALMRSDDFIPPSAWMVRRSLFERLGGFDETFRFSEDWDFLMRVAGLTTPRRVPGVTVEIRMRASGNASADFGEERLDCLRRLAARHGLPPIEPKTFWEVAEAVERAARIAERGRGARGSRGRE